MANDPRIMGLDINGGTLWMGYELGTINGDKRWFVTGYKHMLYLQLSLESVLESWLNIFPDTIQVDYVDVNGQLTTSYPGRVIPNSKAQLVHRELIHGTNYYTNMGSKLYYESLKRDDESGKGTQ